MFQNNSAHIENTAGKQLGDVFCIFLLLYWLLHQLFSLKFVIYDQWRFFEVEAPFLFHTIRLLNLITTRQTSLLILEEFKV